MMVRLGDVFLSVSGTRKKMTERKKVTVDQRGQTLTHTILVAYADQVIENHMQLLFLACTVTQ